MLFATSMISSRVTCSESAISPSGETCDWPRFWVRYQLSIAPSESVVALRAVRI